MVSGGRTLYSGFIDSVKGKRKVFIRVFSTKRGKRVHVSSNRGIDVYNSITYKDL